jgi:hypothetical protein
MIKMLYNSCTGIYKFGNNTYPRHVRRRSNLGHIFREKKCLMGQEIRYVIFSTLILLPLSSSQIFCLPVFVSKTDHQMVAQPIMQTHAGPGDATDDFHFWRQQLFRAKWNTQCIIDNWKLLLICILLLADSFIFFRIYFLSIYGCIPV